MAFAGAGPYIPPALGAIGGIFGSKRSAADKNAKFAGKMLRRGIVEDYQPLIDQIVAGGPMEYFPGQTYAGVNPFEQAAMGGYGDFAASFPSLYNAGLGTYGAMMGGGGPLAPYTSGFAPSVDMAMRGLAGGPGSVQAGSPLTADANAALSQAMSGEADLTGINAAVNAFLNPYMENFQERIAPQLAAADYGATGGQGSAGRLKASQRVLEDIGERGAEYGAGLAFQAQQAARDRQAQAGLGVMGGQLNQTGLGLRADLANLGARQDHLSQLLQGAGLGVSAAGTQAGNLAQFASMFPDYLRAGTMGADAASQAGAMQRGFEMMPIQEQIARWNFQQQAPYAQADWVGGAYGQQANILGQIPSPQGQQNPLLAGALMASAFWPSNPSAPAAQVMPPSKTFRGYAAPYNDPPSSLG